MPRRNHRRRAALFLAAVLLPSAVLVVTTVRLIRQQRELAVRRAQEEQALLALRIGQELLEELRGLEDRAADISPQAPAMFALMDLEPALLTLASFSDGRLVFPWEMYPDASLAERPADSARYTRALERGEEAEYRRADYDEAATWYGQAVEVLEGTATDSNPTTSLSTAGARGPSPTTDGMDESAWTASVHVAEARLHQGSALLRSGRVGEARAVFLQLAESPSFLVDQEGMPFTVYGSEGLQETGSDPRELLGLIRERLEHPQYLSLPAVLAWKDIVGAIAGDGLGGEAGEWLGEVEDVLAQREATLEELERLRRELPIRLGASWSGARDAEGGEEPLWAPFGRAPWLVGILSGGPGRSGSMVVVDPARLLRPEPGAGGEGVGAGAVRDSTSGESDDKVAEGIRLLTLLPAEASEGDPLGEPLNGLRASFPPGFPSPAEPGGVEAWFFRLLLPLILVLTGFTAYLAWRDVRREVEAVRLRSQFVSSVTHELKTPLTSIRMFAETLRLGRIPRQEAQEQYLDTVVHETERLSRLINNVLDFARIDRGEKTYHLAETDVAASAREAARILAYPLAQGEYDLVTEVGEDIPLVHADADALTQALLNLLSNAIKFSDEGSRIDLRVFLDGKDVCLQVEDRGRGISPTDQEAIFQDFYRVAEAEREGIPGTGLGLPLVAHVAEAHRGMVEVQSEPGRGSTFTIRIPVGEPPPEEGEAP